MTELHGMLDLVYEALASAEGSVRMAKESLERAQEAVPDQEEQVHPTILGFRETDPDLEAIFRLAFAADPSNTEYHLRRLALTLNPAARGKFFASISGFRY